MIRTSAKNAQMAPVEFSTEPAISTEGDQSTASFMKSKKVFVQFDVIEFRE
jgi:hypothetical protein